MLGKTFASLALVLLGGLWQAAASNQTQTMVVTVVNKQFDPARAVPGVHVALTFFDGVRRITDDRQPTNQQGQTEMTVSREAQALALAHGDLRLEVLDADGLVIYQPPEGALESIKPSLKVVLVPKGSRALLEPAQIDAMMDRLSRLNLQLVLKNQRLQAEVTKAEAQSPFDRALRDWASSNGLPFDEVDQRVRAWAEDILAGKQKKNTLREAEAELGLRHFGRAAALFQSLEDQEIEEIQRQQERDLEIWREKLRVSFLRSLQSAQAYQSDNQFSKATDAVEKIRKEAVSLYQRNPEDVVLRQIWLYASILVEATRVQEGAKKLNQNPLPLFEKVASNCQLLLDEIDKTKEPEKWAYTQMALSIADVYQAELSNAQKGTELRGQAITAGQAALAVWSREKDPKDWANFQTFNALLIVAQAARSITDGSYSLPTVANQLQEASKAFRSVLEIYPDNEHGAQWAETQTYLAATLSLQGAAAAMMGVRSDEFLEQAEAADRAALTFFTIDNYPQQWASVEGNLAQELAGRGQSAEGAQAKAFFAKAVIAFDAALKVRELEKDKDPVGWANIAGPRADTLKNEAMSSSGAEAVQLLEQAVAGYRTLFEVFKTKESYPRRWATAQTDLGSALAVLAVRKQGAESNELLSQSVTAYNAALEVFTKEEFPQRWAGTQMTLAAVLATQGVRATGIESAQLLAQGVAAYRAAGEVFTRTSDPSQWATIQTSLGVALAEQAVRADGSHSIELFQQAVERFHDALEIFTKARSPREWARGQSSLGKALGALGVRASGDQAQDYFAQSATALNAALEADPDDLETLSSLGSLYHEYLADFPRAYEIMRRAAKVDDSSNRRLDLAEASFTTARFSECMGLLNAMNGSLSAQLTPVQQTILFACQWGSGETTLALQTAGSFPQSMASLTKGSFNTTGDRKYLAAAPEFQRGRPLWIKLFQALQEGDGTAVLDAVSGLGQLGAH